MREATRLVDAGKIRVKLDPSTYSLATAADAHGAIALGAAKGKVVVDIDGSPDPRINSGWLSFYLYAP